MSILSGDLYYLDFADIFTPGTYTWTTTYANDTVNNFAISSPNLEFNFGKNIYKIYGNAFDSTTGTSITSGTAIAIIKETGERGQGIITNNMYSIILVTDIDINKTKFTLGVILSDGIKKGYNQVIIGNGPFTTQVQLCSSNQMHFSGTATDADTGAVISNGTVSVNVKEVNTYTNSTTFSNSNWDIYISPCLISGGLYTFNFIVRSSDGKQSNLFINQIAP
jgi:hypothetical protein